MYEDIIKACQETGKQDLLDFNCRNLDKILRKHRENIQAVYDVLKEKQITGTEFNQKLVNYINNIGGIAAVFELLKNENILTTEYKYLALQNLDLINTIYTADAEIQQQSGVPKKDNEKKYGKGLYMLGIDIKNCIDHIDILREAFEALKNAQLFDNEHIIFVTKHINFYSSAIETIRKSTLSDTDKAKYTSLAYQTTNRGILNFINILDANHILTTENLDLLFKNTANSYIFSGKFKTTSNLDDVSEKFDLDQDLYESIINNPDHHKSIAQALEELYIHYGFVLTNEEYKLISPASLSANRTDAIKKANQRILDTKEKRMPEFIIDKKYIFQCPKHADTIARILVNLHRSGIVMTDDQLKSLCLDDGNYLELVFEALQTLNPPAAKTVLYLYSSKRQKMLYEALDDPTARKTPVCDLHLDEQISDALRKPTKENTLTQAIFDEICKKPRRAMLIAFKHGIQKTKNEQRDYDIAESLGTVLGKIAIDRGDKKLDFIPKEIVDRIGFWGSKMAFDKKLIKKPLDNVTREEVTDAAYSTSVKPKSSGNDH